MRHSLAVAVPDVGNHAAPRPAYTVDFDAEALGRWRRAADALHTLMVDDLEAVALEVDSRDAQDDARRAALTRFQAAVRRRLRPIIQSGGHAISPIEIRLESEAWQSRAEQAIADMDIDPDAVERHARLWLAVVQAAAARGRAALYAR